MSGEVHLEVQDDVIPENNGPFVLEIGDSCAEVRDGGRGDVRIDIRGLAAVYTGHVSPLDLRRIAYADASTEHLAAMAPLFAGPAPWMPDVF